MKRMKTVLWADLIKDLMDQFGASELSRRSNVSRATLYKWSKANSAPDASAVIELSRSIGLSPIYALQVAGYLDEDELTDGGTINLGHVSDDALLEEVRRRFNR